MNIPAPPESTGTPSPARGKRSAWEVQREVLFALIIREATARVGGQWIGAVWTLIEPLAQTVLFVVLYGVLIDRVAPAGEYAVFLATGMVPFQLFQNLSSRLMDGIESNRGLFSYRQVKPIDVLAARAMVEAGMNLLVYAFTLGILGWLDFHVVPADPLSMIGVNALMLAFGTAYGILVAVLTHDRPRSRSLIRISNMPLYLASGIMFPVDLLPRELLDPLLWNPLLHLVELSRHAFIPDYVPVRGVGVLYPFIFMLALLTWGLLLYQAKRQRLIAS
jgi:capsular polysaccharide transport system permease protein